jgi:hypothetical protein
VSVAPQHDQRLGLPRRGEDLCRLRRRTLRIRRCPFQGAHDADHVSGALLNRAQPYDCGAAIRLPPCARDGHPHIGPTRLVGLVGKCAFGAIRETAAANGVNDLEFLSYRRSTASRRRSAPADAAAPIADVIARAEPPYFQPIYALASPGVVMGRVALIGDAWLHCPAPSQRDQIGARCSAPCKDNPDRRRCSGGGPGALRSRPARTWRLACGTRPPDGSHQFPDRSQEAQAVAYRRRYQTVRSHPTARQNLAGSARDCQQQSPALACYNAALQRGFKPRVTVGRSQERGCRCPRARTGERGRGNLELVREADAPSRGTVMVTEAQLDPLSARVE